MQRTAIYARYSDEKQSDRSIEDQIALCEQYAAREGLKPVANFFDRAKTSTTIHGRDGLAKLRDGIKLGEFDVVLVENLDRLSRDQAELPMLHKEMKFHNVKLLSVSDGVADTMTIGLRSMMGELFIMDLKDKVRRGMIGNIRDGLSAGGKAYGYAPIPGEPGKLTIVEKEAEVIRRCFEEYASGESPRNIARGLNKDGIPAPRGKRWNASTLNGSADRNYGLLRNPLYGGILVWNRVRMERNPKNGKRISKVNPQEDWRYCEAPEFQIVSDQLYQHVEQRLKERAHNKHIGRSNKQPKRPLSGLLKCGKCGGGMTIHDRRNGTIRIRCSTSKESGSCSNRSYSRLDLIEEQIFDQLSIVLSDPKYLDAYLDAVREEVKTKASPKQDRAKLERDVVSAKSAFDRLVTLFTDGIIDGIDGKERMRTAKYEWSRAEEALASCETVAPEDSVHPETVSFFQETLSRMKNDPQGEIGKFDLQTLTAFQALVSKVVVTPNEDKTTDVEVFGPISALVTDPNFFWGGAMVAEEGLEPPTRGL